MPTTKPCWRPPIVFCGRAPARDSKSNASWATGGSRRACAGSRVERETYGRLSIGIGPTDDHGNGGQEDPDIQQQRPMVDVVEIELEAPAHLVDGFALAPAAVNLRPARDAGLHAMSAEVAIDESGIFLIVCHGMWSRTDQRHVAGEQV